MINITSHFIIILRYTVVYLKHWSGFFPFGYFMVVSTYGTVNREQISYTEMPLLTHTRLSSVQLLSCVWLFATPQTAACQASVSITNSWRLLKLMSIHLVIPSNHLILCRPLLLPSSVFPSIRVSSNESVHLIKWPKYWTSASRQHIKKQRHYFANKGLSSQSYGFSSSHVWMWELDYKSWALKNWCFELWCWRRLLRVPWTSRRVNVRFLNTEIYSVLASFVYNTHFSRKNAGISVITI